MITQMEFKIHSEEVRKIGNLMFVNNVYRSPLVTWRPGMQRWDMGQFLHNDIDAAEQYMFREDIEHSVCVYIIPKRPSSQNARGKKLIYVDEAIADVEMILRIKFDENFRNKHLFSYCIQLYSRKVHIDS